MEEAWHMLGTSPDHKGITVFKAITSVILNFT